MLKAVFIKWKPSYHQQLDMEKETKPHIVIFHLYWFQEKEKSDMRAHKMRMPLKQYMTLELDPICSSLKIN